jgi:hemolysin activation/secretion protein
LFVNSDFTVQRINLEALDANLYQDNLRVLRAGSTYDFVDSTNAVNRIEANVFKGFGWDTDNGGLSHSRANGNASFWKGTANITRIQPVYEQFSFFASVDGQMASRGLFAAEEYALGGERFGSAFDPAELSGDSAIASRFELQYNGVSESKFLPSYQPYVFYDIGRVWNRGAIASELRAASLASAGVGTRFNIADSVTGGLEYAFPLTRSVATGGADGDAGRLFFNLQYRY